jgi:uncharacterized repeat protein (TIGR03803 family)
MGDGWELQRGGNIGKLNGKRAYAVFLLCATTAIALRAQTFTTLYSFDITDGALPHAGLVQATNGNFYGTTSGGTVGYGTVFKITPSGQLTTLDNFGTDGYEPKAGLVQDTNGKFYGTAEGGGAHDYGTVFGLSLGLGPFVETQPTSGKVGAAVEILGTSLTDATSVTFNGTAAHFKVISGGFRNHRHVPAGATTGKVKVTTPTARCRATCPSECCHRVRPSGPRAGGCRKDRLTRQRRILATARPTVRGETPSSAAHSA